MSAILKRLLSLLHTFCNHPDNEVTADLNQSDVGSSEIMWCRICGAVNRSGNRGPNDWELARSPWIRWLGRTTVYAPMETEAGVAASVERLRARYTKP